MILSPWSGHLLTHSPIIYSLPFKKHLKSSLLHKASPDWTALRLEKWPCLNYLSFSHMPTERPVIHRLTEEKFSSQKAAWYSGKKVRSGVRIPESSPLCDHGQVMWPYGALLSVSLNWNNNMHEIHYNDENPYKWALFNIWINNFSLIPLLTLKGQGCHLILVLYSKAASTVLDTW